MVELFHAVTDEDSAAARREVVARGLIEKVRFRNIVYPEVVQDFAARGGQRVPALWDGERLVEGKDAVLAALAAL